MDVVILTALILMNGAFAMSEMALVTARKGRLKELVAAGDASATVALRLAEDPSRFLSTIQIGITSIGILNGIVGEAALAPVVSAWLRGLGVEEPAAGYVGTGLVVVLITYFSIVLGELVPKRLGQINPEAVSCFVSRPMQWLSGMAKPFVRLLSGSTELVLRALQIKAGASRVTQEEIRGLLAEGLESGAIEEQEHTIVRNVFRLDDRQLGSLLVPRSEVVSLDSELPWEENVKRIVNSGHTRFPVVKGGLRNVLGVISARRLLAKTIRGERPDLTSDLQPAVFVPENLTGLELLQQIRSSGTQLLFVIDEYGETLGIVTLRDVLEAITGEFKARIGEAQWATQRDDGSWLLDGLIAIPDLKDRLNLRAVPEGDYHTLAGMLLFLLGRVPKAGEKVEWESLRFEIVDMDGHRIDKVLASRMQTPPVDTFGET